MKKKLATLTALAAAIVSPWLWAQHGDHGGHDHGGHNEQVPVAATKTTFPLYREKIEPIFRLKCFDCHSANTRYPWYYRIPGAKQLIDYDTREAREHIDMTDGFPFKGHHSAEEQLKDLQEVVEENKMPLRRYRLLHAGSGLTHEEREKILEWLKILK